MAIKKLLATIKRIQALEIEHKKYSEGHHFDRQKRDAIEVRIEKERLKEYKLLEGVTRKEYEEHLECGYGITYDEFKEQ